MISSYIRGEKVFPLYNCLFLFSVKSVQDDHKIQTRKLQRWTKLADSIIVKETLK